MQGACFQDNKETVFLISKKQRVKNLFQGYCFVGKDYVSGSEGALAFQKEKGACVPVGEDGCYVTADTDSNGDVRISTDFYGYKKVFYYWDESFWAVSNSIFILCEHLKENGVRITPNYGQLAAIRLSNSALNQLPSFYTYVNGVKLLPLGVSLIIGDSGVCFEKIPKKECTYSYESELENFLDIWVSRFETLMNDSRIKITSDITGGLDSRVIFAILHFAASRLGVSPEGKVRLKCGSVRGDTADLDVARIVCRTFGMPLNSRPVGSAPPLDGYNSYITWKCLSLGSYHPIYMPNYLPDSFNISFSGGGGENYRPFYEKFMKSKSIDRFVDSNSSRVHPEWLSYQFREEIQESFSLISENSGEESDPLMLHYQHFRNRFHAGRAPQSTVTFNALGSWSLNNVANLAGVERLGSAQIYFDIINSLCPKLLDISFDKPEKSPSDSVLKGLAEIKLGVSPSPGAVYAGKERYHERCNGEGEKLSFLEADFHTACRNPFVRSFWGDDFIEENKRVLELAVRDGKLKHAVDGQGISAIIASSVF